MLNKVTYINNQTVIGANNLNDIQDEIINNSNEINDLKSNTIMKNYSIIDGMNEPINPTENMIWIQVENFNQVHFSDVKPSKLNNNDIWIQTGNASSVTFNSIKIGHDTMNTIHPISAKQYISGAWVAVTAKSYQSGEWVTWVTDQYLYNTGNEFTDLTGGLKAYAIAYASSGSYSENMAPIITRNTSSITIKHNSSYTDKSGIVRFENKIDLSNYRTLKFDGTLSGGRASIYIWSSIGSYYGQNYVAYKAGSASGEISVDIPAGVGECYIGFGIDHTQTITLNKLWLEG